MSILERIHGKVIEERQIDTKELVGLVKKYFPGQTKIDTLVYKINKKIVETSSDCDDIKETLKEINFQVLEYGPSKKLSDCKMYIRIRGKDKKYARLVVTAHAYNYILTIKEI